VHPCLWKPIRASLLVENNPCILACENQPKHQQLNFFYQQPE